MARRVGDPHKNRSRRRRKFLGYRKRGKDAAQGKNRDRS